MANLQMNASVHYEVGVSAGKTVDVKHRAALNWGHASGCLGSPFTARGLDRGQQCFHARVIAESAADVDVAVYVTRTEDEASAELKWILAEFVLAVAGRTRTVAGALVVGPQHVQQVRVVQAGGAVGQPLLVDQQREGDARLFAKQARVALVAQANGRQVGAPLAKVLLVYAQLRDMLAAEDSTIVAQEDYHRRLPLPKRTQADLLATGIGQDNGRKRFGQHI